MTYSETITSINEAISELTRDGKTDLAERVADARACLKIAKNELCLKCGNYREAHLGACNGCRFYE